MPARAFEFFRNRTPRPARHSALLAVGTDDVDAAAGTCVNDQPKTVQPDDGRHQVQAKPHARCAPDLVRPVEAPQHGLALLFADAAAAIGHAYDDLAAGARQLDAHLAAFGRELDGVVDEVGDRLEQKIAVATHAEPVARLDPQGDILVLGNRLVEVADLAQHLLQRHAAETRRAPAVFDLGQA